MKAKRLSDGGIAWWCPACDEAHRSDGRWRFNGDFDSPSFQPSFKVVYRHPKGHDNDNPAPVGYSGPYVEDICHSIVTAGRIWFAPDSTHALAGKTVDLPDWPFNV